MDGELCLSGSVTTNPGLDHFFWPDLNEQFRTNKIWVSVLVLLKCGKKGRGASLLEV